LNAGDGWAAPVRHVRTKPRKRWGERLLGLIVGLLAVAAAIAIGAISSAQVVREPVPRPAGAYTLHATVYSPAERVYLAGLASESAPLGGGYHEVHAYVPAARVGPFDVAAVGISPARSWLDATTLQAIDTLGAIRLRVTDGAATHTVSLSGPGTNTLDHELARTRYRHVSLGRFGFAHVWLTARARSQQIDVIVNWHTGRWGTTAGDVFFSSAELILPPGVSWRANLPDSVSTATHLVKPGSYWITQRAERPFRFSVLPDAATYRAPWATLGTQPDLPLLGFRVPPSLWQARVDVAEWRSKLAALQPTLGTDPVTSALWPAAGVRYGGMTGGDDMHPLDGVRWIAGGEAAGFERYAIESLRYRSRHWGALYEADGSPVRPSAGTWRYYDSQFERGEVGPYTFPPRRISPGSGPEVFASIDAQHLVRVWNHDAVLAIVGADPLARQYVLVEAAKTLMTFWPRAGDRAYRWPAVLPGRGTGLGRAEAWGAIVIAHALTLGADRALYAPWIERYVSTLATAQMPSGLFQINQGKESRNPPFSTGGTGSGDGTAVYLIGSGLEECYHALALHALRGRDARIPAMLERHAQGMERLAWVGGGVWSHSARGHVATGALYTTREDWPQSLRDALASGSAIPTNPYVDGYHVAYAIAALRSEALLLRYTNTSSVTAALTKIRSWGVTPPGGTPIEQVWPLLTSW
jgi:hypothetical protein